MRFHRLMLATAAGLALGVGAAAADCREELAALTGGGAKDGSMAPLSGEAGGATPQTGGDGMAAEAPAEGVAKDGSATPLATDPGIATSAQDVEAQAGRRRPSRRWARPDRPRVAETRRSPRRKPRWRPATRPGA